MIPEQNRLTEGMTSFLGGANSAVDPALIPSDQYSWAENVDIRDGYPRTRPNFRFIKLLPSGVVQGASRFATPGQLSETMLGMIDGKLYDLSPQSPLVEARDISPVGETNPFISRTACLTQTTNFLVVQDGLSPALVYNGVDSFRSQDRVKPSTPAVILEGCTLTAGSPTITVTNLADVQIGMLALADAGFVPENTTISSFDIANLTITLSNPVPKTIVINVSLFLPGVVRDNISIPVGSVMCFGNGRLWVANGNNLYAGDLVGTDISSEIAFSEIIYLTGGGSFYFPELITGMFFLPGVDSSVGQGDLIVFTKVSVYAVRATVYDRTTWQSTPNMVRKIFSGPGSFNQDSIIALDRDIYYRANDGIRSLTQNLTGYATVSLTDSLEAKRILEFDTERWSRYAPGVIFNGRYLVGAAPKVQRITDDNNQYTGAHNIVFSKLVVKDFLAGAATKNPEPAYCGEWNGLQICKLVEGNFEGQRRCFAITCDPDGKNCLYELLTSYNNDEVKPSRVGDIVSTPINCSMELRRFSFGAPLEIKELLRADVGFSEVYGNLNWNLDYSPDFLNVFYPIQSRNLEYEQGTLELTTQAPPNLPLGFKTIRTVKPTSACVDTSNRLSNFGFMFQGKISWEGTGKLVFIRLHAYRKDISDLGEC